MALPLAWSVGVVVGWGGALCFLLSPFSALALVAPASGGWLGASLSLVVVVLLGCTLHPNAQQASAIAALTVTPT